MLLAICVMTIAQRAIYDNDNNEEVDSHDGCNDERKQIVIALGRNMSTKLMN